MKKLTGISLFIFFCVVTATLAAGLVFYDNNKGNLGQNSGPTNTSNTTISNLLSSGVTVLDSKEVSKHNTISDCWIIVNSKVYDISNYASAHPGGVMNVASSCGKESTKAYDTKGGAGGNHSTSAYNLLTQYYIGDLNQKINQGTLAVNVGKAKANPGTTSANPTPQGVPTSGTTILNATEIAKHNTVSDCWMIINNKIYNVSGYASAHPGGSMNIANYCGKEATQAFATKGGNGNSHSVSANSLLAQYYIGDLNQSISQNTLNQTLQNIQANPPPTTGQWEDDD